MKNPFEPLDQEENDLLHAIENDEFVEVDNIEEEMKKARETARNTLNKLKNINIRLSYKDIQKLKIKAVETGIPYQTLAASVIRQFANDKIEVKL